MQSNQPHNKRVRCKLHYLLLAFFAFLLLIIWTALLVSVIKDKAIPMFTRSKRYDISSYINPVSKYRDAIPGLAYNRVNIAQYEESVNTVNIELFTLGEIVTQWNPDDVSLDKWSNSLAHPNKGKHVPRYDYMNKDEMRLASLHQQAEMPFIVYNMPEIESTINTDFTIESLQENFGDELLMVEQSTHLNHFTYYKDNHIRDYKRIDPSYAPPQRIVEMKFDDYLYLSQEAEKYGPVVNNVTLHYYTISAHDGYELAWLRNALPFFKREKSFFIIDPAGFKGINCRFGQKGVIATAHYDGGRNFVAMLRGRKRYILLPPKECKNLHLLPRSHPSARHSDLDWSDIHDLSQHDDIWHAQATEVILAPGDVLYIPSYWFHYIISQDASIQCNARSGGTDIGREHITACGFYESEGEEKEDKRSKQKPRPKSKPKPIPDGDNHMRRQIHE